MADLQEQIKAARAKLAEAVDLLVELGLAADVATAGFDAWAGATDATHYAQSAIWKLDRIPPEAAAGA